MKSARNRTLQAKIRDNVRQGRLISGVVIDVFFNKATVKLSGNGSILHGLPIIGGPIKAGQSVNVDFTTNQPTVVAQGNEGVSAEDLDKALKSLQDNGLNSQLQLNILVYSGGGLSGTYSPSEDGFIAALGVANPGDVVWLPDVDIETDFSVPSGVSLCGLSSRQSILRGTCTLGTDCSLENLAIINALSSETEVNAVIAQGSGDSSWIKNCEIHAYNCGNGIANAISIQASTTLLQVTHSVVVGDCKEASESHAFTGLGGTCKVLHSNLYSKSSSHWDGTTFYEYSNIGHVSEINRMCTLPTSEIYQSLRIWPVGDKYRPSNATVFATPNVQTAFTGTYDMGNNRWIVAQFENFIYFAITNPSSGNRILREFNVNTGNTIDMVLWNYSSGVPQIYTRYAAVTKREVYVTYYTSSSVTRIYKVNFETEESTLIYEFDSVDDDGAPITGYGYAWFSDMRFTAVKKADGNLYVVLIALLTTYEEEHVTYGDLYSVKPVFFIKNYTENGSWTRVNGPALANTETESHWLTITIDLYTVVQNRYIVCSGSYAPGGSTVAMMGVWGIDLDTNTAFENHITQDPKYSSFSPTTWDIGADENGYAYIAYNDDFSISNESYRVLYRYEPSSNTFEMYHRNSDSSFWILLVSSTKCFLAKSLTTWTIIDLADLSTFNSGMTWPTASRYNVVYDNNLMIFFSSTTGDLIWYDITDEGTATKSLGISSDTSGATIDLFNLKDTVVIFSNKWLGGSTYNAKVFVITEGA